MRLSNLSEEDIKLFFGNDEDSSKDKTSKDEVVIGFEPEKNTQIITKGVDANQTLKEEKTRSAFFNAKPINKKDSEYDFYFKKAETKTKINSKTASYITYLLTTFKFIGIFIVLFSLSFLIVNFSAVSAKVKYAWENNNKKEKRVSSYLTPQKIPFNESKLIIPKIGLNAPISWDASDMEIPAKLETGLVHYIGTAKPGENGNTFITGHSSYYSWAKGNYKSVFALLDKLKIDDDIYLHYRGASFHYKVKESFVVKPDNLDVLSNSKKNILTLMTCTPIGTDLYRHIIIAEQVFSSTK